MGIYDREYYHDDRPGLHLRAPRTAVGLLILINVAVYLAAQLFPSLLSGERFGLQVGTLGQPWMWWQFVTYGFMHAPSPTHVLFNMLGLWFLGRDVENRYGSREFLWVYLVLVVAGGVFWTALNKFLGAPNWGHPLVGASGAISGVVILYALNFPRNTILLFFVLPMPAWVLGVFLVATDALGAMQQDGSNIAYSVHLVGAGAAALYFYFGWNLSHFGDRRFWRERLRPRPDLKIHVPKDDESTPEPTIGQDLAEQVDQILEKIHREGETSLTRRERRVLESASREYQRRRRPQP
jgi:membrane associated rhomboid family serine protease